MRTSRLFGMIGLFAAAVAAAPAQDKKDALPPPEPGAKEGGEVPSVFRTYVVYDPRYGRPAKKTVGEKDEKGEPRVWDVRDRTGKIHCLVCENGLSPVV